MYNQVVLDAGDNIRRLYAFSKDVLAMPASPEVLATYVAELAVSAAFRDVKLRTLIAKLHGMTDDYYNRGHRAQLQQIVGDLGMALFRSADHVFSEAPMDFNVKTVLPNGVVMQRKGNGPALSYASYMDL